MAKKHNITPNNIHLFSQPVEHVYQELQQDIVEQIAKRLRSSREYTSDNVLEWQMQKLSELHLVNEDTVKALSKATGIADKQIRQAINDTGIATIESVDKELKNVYSTLPMPSNIDNVLESYVNQTFRELNNYVNQTLITTNYGEGSAMKLYRKIIEETTGKVLAGTTTFHKAVAETTVKWANSGVMTGFIDRGGNPWSLERYISTVIKSTVNRTYNDLRMSRMSEYDVNTVVVTTVPDPRNICSQIQGKVASILPIDENDTGYPSVYEFGYGEPSGIRGINCRHMFVPFIPGVNTNTQPQYTEDEMKENREEREKQRYLERRIKESKRGLKIAEIYGDDEVIAKYKKQVRDRQSVIREFINKTKRTRQYERERVII